MKVIFFNGNLGNQVFYCAYKDYLEKKFPGEKIYYCILRGCPPIKVESIFYLQLPDYNYIVNIVSCFVFYINILLLKVFNLHLPSFILCGRGTINDDAIFFSNYLQDKFFYEKQDSNWLQIKMPKVLSPNYFYYERLIQETDSICIHIRRGDYIKSGSYYADLSSTDYYHKAISLAITKFPNGKLFFFSDDLDFVRKNFKYNNAYFVDCNQGDNSFLDIKLMSLAKVNIIANSTFSYWGAYIGHEGKKVIYPKRWFTEASGRNAPNIMLDNWIGI